MEVFLERDLDFGRAPLLMTACRKELIGRFAHQFWPLRSLQRRPKRKKNPGRSKDKKSGAIQDDYTIVNMTGFHMISKNDPELIKIAEDCGKLNSVDITIFEPEKHADMMKLFEEKNYRCFAKCMTEKAGLVNNKGEANKEDIKKRFELEDDHVVFKHLDECYGKVESDDICDQVFEIEKCIMENLHKS